MNISTASNGYLDKTPAIRPGVDLSYCSSRPYHWAGGGDAGAVSLAGASVVGALVSFAADGSATPSTKASSDRMPAHRSTAVWSPL